MAIYQMKQFFKMKGFAKLFGMRDLVNLLNEAGMLDAIFRSGFAFLGNGAQSVAEHSFRMAITAFVIARQMAERVDLSKLLLMALFHDLPEARTGDLNYVNKKYVTANESKVLEDLKQECRLGTEIAALVEEYKTGATLEAQIAHDADQLELMLKLKRELDLGNSFAKEWLNIAKQRVKLAVSKKLAEEILQTPWNEWWIKDKSDPYWVHGSNNKE